jgi:hypothetical protein
VAISEDLDLLENSIRQLQMAWERFFGSVEKFPPNDLQAKVEALVRKYAYAEMRNMTERFRYQTMTARFNTFNELWRKRLRAREEGHAVGVHGLKAIMPPPLDAAAAPAASAAAKAARPAGPEAAEVRLRSAEDAGVRQLFAQFAAARQSTGEPAVKFESFQKLIAQQTTRIVGEKGASAVDFRIETKDGKVGLKAKPVR